MSGPKDEDDEQPSEAAAAFARLMRATLGPDYKAELAKHRTGGGDFRRLVRSLRETDGSAGKR